MRDVSLHINSLASSNSVSYMNLSQNGANILSKIVLKIPFFFFVKQFKISCRSDQYDFVQILRACGTISLRNVWRDLRLPMSASATVTRKSFNVNFTTKIDVSRGYFMLLLLTS